MANIQRVSLKPKLQPVNNGNNENSAMASSNKKKYFPRLVSGKENIDVNVKQSVTKKVYFGNSRFCSPEKYRRRKASDSAIIHHAKKKHDIPVSNKIKDLINHSKSKKNFLPKRHLSETSENSGSSHTIVDGFPKPDFKIYTSNEETKAEAPCSKDYSGIPKGKNLHSRKLKVTSIITLEENVELFKLQQTHSKIENLKLENPRVQNLLLTDTTKTPVNSVPVPVNLNQIKVHHKKSNLDEKYQKISSDNLPADLLYNLEYMEDFIAFQLALERSHQLSPEFLSRGINREQRRMVVSVLIRLTSIYFYPSNILYQTVKIFDAMLDSKRINIDQLQLVALTALWITLKRLHTVSHIPSTEEILFLFKENYSEKDLFQCEMNIMIALNCEISFIDPFSILAYYIININNPSVQVNRTDMIYCCASYMIDVSLLSTTFSKSSTIALIAAAAELAVFIVSAKKRDLENPVWQFWRSCLPTIFYDGKGVKVTEIEEARKKLIHLALLSNGSSKDYLSVYNKYKHSEYGYISDIIIGRLSKVPKSVY